MPRGILIGVMCSTGVLIGVPGVQRLEVLLEEAVIDDVCSKFGCSASDVVDAVPPP